MRLIAAVVVVAAIELAAFAVHIARRFDDALEAF